MGTDIHHTSLVKADRAAAFAYIADYRNVSSWLYGVDTFEPVGEKDYGLGSIFDTAMSLGVSIKSRLETVAFTEGELIEFESVKGFKAVSRWSFADAGHDNGAPLTEVTADITYTLPFGPAGKAMGKVMAPFVTKAVTQSSAKLKTNIEAQAG